MTASSAVAQPSNRVGAGNVLNARRRPSGLGRPTKTRQHFTGSPRHVVHANPPASGRSSRPARWGLFPNIWLGLSFPPASSRSSSTKEARGTEQTKKGAFCLSLFLGPVEIVGLSTAPCLPRDFISWNRAPPSQTLVPIAWDRVENLHHAQDRFEIGGLAFVCPPQDEGMMGWWSLDQTRRLVEVSRLQTQQAGA